jgi:hypothetical protein
VSTTSTTPATSTTSPAAVPGQRGAARSPFLASHDGFAFHNSWPSEPAVVFKTPFGKVDVGNASGGLCGGMVFAALDYWHAGVLPPVDQPAAGTPLYKFLVKRIVDSWHVPVGIAQYYQWMGLPDGDSDYSAFGRRIVVEQGVAWRTIRLQWPAIKKDLDRGVPCGLGLVTVASRKPKDLGQNHQVLAYGYETSPELVTVKVYDPNSGQDDSVGISFDPRSPTQPTTFDHTINMGHPVRGFFRVAYSPVPPPT